jgi:hypothetical protein
MICFISSFYKHHFFVIKNFICIFKTDSYEQIVGALLLIRTVVSDDKAG